MRKNDSLQKHPTLTRGVIHSLDLIFNQEQYADRVIEKVLKLNKKWGSRDRRFVAESVYDIVRSWRRYLFISEQKWPQLVYSAETLEKVAHSYWKHEEQDPRWRESEGVPTLRESVPDWFFEQGTRELGAEWPELLASLNTTAPLYLRTNTLKTTRAEVIRLLAGEGVEAQAVDGSEVALMLPKKVNVFRTKAFHQGCFEVQDLGSQKISELVDPKPGHRIIDACAGAGGKTLHLAALMKNKGKVVALDTQEWKLKELGRRAKRAGVHVVEKRVIENQKVIKRLTASCDVLLLDVPCSGVGILRRNPDVKWKLKPETLEELRKTQAEILETYSDMVKPAGAMVYSTCSVWPSENEGQIHAFLETHPEWKLEKELFLTPSIDRTDGFYAARLSKG